MATVRGEAMNPPEISYAKSGDVHIAYQVLGDGPLDLIYAPEFWNSIEAMWEEPGFEKFLLRLASFSRLICFDQRASGLSDPVAPADIPSLEGWVDDVRAVMEDAGSSRAALLGSGGGGLMSMLFAASHPEQVQALVLVNSFPRLTRADDYPWGTSPDHEDRIIREMEHGWGRGVLLETVAPSVAGSPEFRRWWGRCQRLGCSPGTMLAIRRMLQQADVRDVLPTIRVPTLVVHRKETWAVDAGCGRYLADHIPGARYLEVPGIDFFVFVGDSDAILDEVEEFLTGVRRGESGARVLATVLFTDIAKSTERAAEIGDRRWGDLLESHHSIVRTQLSRFQGREIDTIGDGFLATFDGPARGIRCAREICSAVRELGLEVRAGLHTGEIELVGNDIRGIAVHIGARVSSLAGPGEVLVSSTVKDLVAGSGIEFEDRGMHELKGVPGEWRIFAVTSG
jgi:class 3 adenylate cyclase/pimeloyl-ACP methyl ester carboxylesterase